jgi:hypothetical protein
MKIYFVWSLVACMMAPLVVSAQSASKAERMIYDLSDSGFLDTYRDYRRKTETDVALFKARMSEHSAEDWVRVKASYEETAGAFERFLVDIRNDLLDGQKRREMNKDTEGYARERLAELDKIYQEYYQGRFFPLYARINHLDVQEVASQRTAVDGPVWAVLITPITLATTKIVDFVDDRKDKKLDEFKEVLEKEWMQPNRFRRWDEI